MFGSTIGGRVFIGGAHFFKSDDALFKVIEEEETLEKQPEEVSRGKWKKIKNIFRRCRPSISIEDVELIEEANVRVKRHTSAINFSNVEMAVDFIISDHTVIIGRLWIDNLVVNGKLTIDKSSILSYELDRVAISARGCSIHSVLEIINSSLILGCSDFKEANIKSSVSLENSIFSVWSKTLKPLPSQR